MTLIPQRDLVLIKADKAIEKSKTGLLVKEDWKSLPLQGKVLETGPKVTNVKSGDRVLFGRYASVILGDDERLCKASHIFGVIHG